MLGAWRSHSSGTAKPDRISSSSKTIAFENLIAFHRQEEKIQRNQTGKMPVPQDSVKEKGLGSRSRFIFKSVLDAIACH